MERVLRRLCEWAAGRDDIRGLVLVGSRARGEARADSDLDVVLLTTQPARYVERDDWLSELGGARPVAMRPWGAITERRFELYDVEVDLGVGEPSWAAVEPVDPGTRRVVADGARVLHDPDGALAALVAACR